MSTPTHQPIVAAPGFRIIDQEQALQMLRSYITKDVKATNLADRWNVPRSSMSAMLAGRQEISDAVLEGMGIRRITTYVIEVEVDHSPLPGGWSQIPAAVLRKLAEEDALDPKRLQQIEEDGDYVRERLQAKDE